MVELNGCICLGVLVEGTSLTGCRVNPVLKSLGKGRRGEDNRCTAITPGPLQVQRNRNTALAVAGNMELIEQN